jgi:putative acetyltransferase
MKIRKLTPEEYAKASALLQQTFSKSAYEAQLFENLHRNGKTVHEWVCIHVNMVIAYIAFTKAYHGSTVCGLHLGPLAVKPEFQHQGIGSELLRFALRQDVIRENTLFVLGAPGFYQQFGFEPCAQPLCPFDRNNAHFLSIRNTTSSPFSVGYESEFSLGAGSGHGSGGQRMSPKKSPGKKGRGTTK